MAEADSRYIAAHLTDIVDSALQQQQPEERDVLAQFAGQLGIYYSLLFRERSESLKSLYRHFNPGVPERRASVTSEQRAALKTEFFTEISDLLQAANYRELSIEQIQEAMDEQALFQLQVSVNLDDYDRLIVFRRGAQPRSMTLKRWLGRFGEREVEFVNYDRVALVFAENTPGSDIHLKLFQNVPRHDIEILLPEPRVRMRLRDKLIIGVPAVIGGTVVLLTKLGPTLLLIGSLLAFWVGLGDEPVSLDRNVVLALGVGLFALGGHFWRQFSAWKNRRLEFLKVLTENLYFKSLDNNSGAIQQLLDTAADEEVKEVFLVFTALSNSGRSMSSAELDQEVENSLSMSFSCECNFDVEGAAKKAVDLGLVRMQNGRYSAAATTEALAAVNTALTALVFPG